MFQAGKSLQGTEGNGGTCAAMVFPYIRDCLMGAANIAVSGAVIRRC
jgi:preprotein translocase subunit SecB